MGRVSHDTKLRIISLYKKGTRVFSIVKELNSTGVQISRQQVSYWITQYCNGQFNPDSVTVKPKVFKAVSQRDLEVVQRSLSRTCLQSSTDLHKELKNDGASFSLSTTQRLIKAAGFTNSTPRYSQMVKERNLQPRVDFCQTLIDMNDNLDDIIFTDESSVQLHNNRTTSYRPTGSARTSIPKPKHPLKVHVWAGISRRGPTPMLIFDGIMESTFFTNHILEETLLPFVKKTYPDGHRFQQDNDPKHRSAISKKFMEENGINWWNVWPSESPDLNPIEFVWNQMKRHVAKAGPRTKEELEECLQHFWRTEMTVELCNRYIDHLFKVAPVCVAMRGKATGDIPQRLFSERSREKSFGHFASLLQTESVTKKLESFNV